MSTTNKTGLYVFVGLMGVVVTAGVIVAILLGTKTITLNKKNTSTITSTVNTINQNQQQPDSEEKEEVEENADPVAASSQTGVTTTTTTSQGRQQSVTSQSIDSTSTTRQQFTATESEPPETMEQRQPIAASSQTGVTTISTATGQQSTGSHSVASTPAPTERPQPEIREFRLTQPPKTWSIAKNKTYAYSDNLPVHMIQQNGGSIPTYLKKCKIKLTLKCIKRGAIPAEKKYSFRLNGPTTALSQSFMFKLPPKNNSKDVEFIITKSEPIRLSQDSMYCQLTAIESANVLRVMQIRDIVITLID